jgi:hypothetical protein
MVRCSCRRDAARLREEQTAIGHPLSPRIRLSQLESELRQGLANISDSLRAAIDAATAHVITTAGGAVAVQKSPLACRHLSMLASYRNPLPPPETVRLRLGLLDAAWQAMDAAMASLDEIRFDSSLGRGKF